MDYKFRSKDQCIARLLEYCRGHQGFEDVIVILSQTTRRTQPTSLEDTETIDTVGFVYLVKHGSRREYKIRKTVDPIRREGEVSIALPEKIEPVHVIKTDDPSGIERYWHMRFKDKRMNGEWFALTAQDVRAFKRWHRIF